MAWIAAAIFGVAVLYFTIHHPGFRKVVLFLLGGVFVLAAAGGAWLYWDQQRAAARSAYAKTLIQHHEVDFYEMTMSGGIARSVKGTVRNRSSRTLRSFKLRIVIQDCPDGKCETIGESDLWETYINVPPGQVRAFDSYVSFPNMPLPQAQQWNYRVTELEAKVD